MTPPIDVFFSDAPMTATPLGLKKGSRSDGVLPVPSSCLVVGLLPRDRRVALLDGSAVHVRLEVSDQVRDGVHDALDASELRDALHDLPHGLAFDFDDEIELAEEFVSFDDRRDFRQFTHDGVFLVRNDFYQNISLVYGFSPLFALVHEAFVPEGIFEGSHRAVCVREYRNL